ncbi:helix-turn-helix domain-containing protein [Oceanobacillus neutriphilus]|uniref:HTH cro/C1-type domain-containing protein n=1 Tax=Oceanobacillus neutriphilus TaxID=531815 RepID=A0ABQ2NTB0_9BACI|nr:helix-turn-helix transcriptional regulator [Oceanobacillus neutriphilus]GGP09913.1 hypothetical protein GCM10011346_15920 [Oceanobacillus neutriphilus]
MAAFHEKLKRERMKHHISQEQLAEKLNISRQSISKWERKAGYPNVEMLIEISNLFDISIDELLKEDEHLQEKIIKDSKQLAYPKLKIFFTVLVLFGILFTITGIVIAFSFAFANGIFIAINAFILLIIAVICLYFVSNKYK